MPYRPPRRSPTPPDDDEALLEEHADSEVMNIGDIPEVLARPGLNRNDVSNLETISSASITLTRRCLVVVVTLFVTDDRAKRTDIMRDNVIKTKETIISPHRFVGFFRAHTGHLQYATEVLPAGTYTYTLTSTFPGVFICYGSMIKIVAIT